MCTKLYWSLDAKLFEAADAELADVPAAANAVEVVCARRFLSMELVWLLVEFDSAVFAVRSAGLVEPYLTPLLT